MTPSALRRTGVLVRWTSGSMPARAPTTRNVQVLKGPSGRHVRSKPTDGTAESTRSRKLPRPDDDLASATPRWAAGKDVPRDRRPVNHSLQRHHRGAS